MTQFVRVYYSLNGTSRPLILVVDPNAIDEFENTAPYDGERSIAVQASSEITRRERERRIPRERK